MPRIISIVNQKGGVGKTTTAVNLAAYLAAAGKFVLLIDLDPQANASSGLGLDYRNLEKGVYHSLIGASGGRHEVLPHADIEGLRILPATPDLAGANIDLVHLPKREFRLHEVIQELKPGYDYIIIDNPPSLGLLTVNGLVGADELIIPVQTEYYALEGLSQLLKTIDLVKNKIKPNLNILGALMTMYDDRNKLSGEIFHELYRYFPGKIFRTVIPRNTKLAEAPSFGLPIMHYDPRGRGAKAYRRLAEEVILTNSI